MSGRQQTPRDAREIESALDRNRANIDHTLDKLEHKFSPGALFDQAWHYARAQNADGSSSRLKETVVRNPLPVVLVGVGLAWLTLAGRSGSVPRNDRATDEREPAAAGRASSPPASSSPSRPRSAAAADDAPSTPAPPARLAEAAAANTSGSNQKTSGERSSAGSRSSDQHGVPAPDPSASERTPPAAKPRTRTSTSAKTPAPPTSDNRSKPSNQSSDSV